ncbi:hypothetical protein ASE01_03700 [Nocardioides sp. Root190]|uniref:hypothetical protein n=1 Tax=Nocardioides sp. Root190 TaxID=1736488 RepID=UPI0006FEEAFC|nr:hypothetical protein [Nocardioides sp. Root190]KRB78391.1 hypothetical protein ASE01_03700 [Nocardioides sp. Root190]
MRSIKRPIVATSAAVLLALSFAACGDGDDKASDDKSSESTPSDDASSDATDGTDASGEASTGAPTGGAGDASTVEFCAEITNIIEVSGSVTGEQPNESEWKKIQEAYADLGEAGPPDDIPATEKQGFEIAVEAVTSLSYAEAEKAFGDADGSGDIPGVSPEDNDKAEKFFAWAGTACPELGGGAPAE